MRVLTIVSLGNGKGTVRVRRLSEGGAPCGHIRNRLGPTSCGFMQLSRRRFISLLYKGSNDFFSLLSTGLRPLREFNRSPIKGGVSIRSSQVGLGNCLSIRSKRVIFTPDGLPCLTGCRLRGKAVMGS